MLKRRGLVTAGLCCCVSVFGWAKHTEAAADKVTVCHKADSVKFFEITVGASSVPAHLAHGDCVVDDGVACTVDSCDAVLGCVHAPDDGACDDGDACTSDSCDPDSGCVNSDNLTCGDGLLCPGEECESNSDCPAGYSCVDCVCTPGDPECAGASCETFVPCNPDSGCNAPVCGSIVEGGGACVEGATPCSSLAPCTTSADCPGSFCFEASCCGIPVCGPPFCSDPAATAVAPASGTGPTFGGQ